MDTILIHSSKKPQWTHALSLRQNRLQTRLLEGTPLQAYLRFLRMNQISISLSPYFHNMYYLFDHFPLQNDWWLVHFFTQLVWSSISPNKYVTSSFHHSTTCFSWWTSRLVLRPPGPYLIHDEASTPDVLQAKAEACRARLDGCRGIPLPFI